MATTRHSFFPPDLRDVLRIIVQFNDDEFSALERAVRSEYAFDSDIDRCAELAPLLNLDPETTQFLIGSVSYLYAQANARWQSAEMSEAISDLIDGRVEADSPEMLSRLSGRLLSLISANDSAETYRKRQRLSTGFLDNAQAFSSFVDLRPSFSADKMNTPDFVTVVQLRITTDSDVPERETIILQMSQSSLRQLRKELDAIDQKVKTLGKLDLRQLSRGAKL